MNCDKAQENVYEYLDGSLSLSESAALRAHVERCAACREIVEREINLARSISSRLERFVKDARLQSHAQRRIAAIAAKNLARSRQYSVVSFRIRIALRFAAVAVILGIVVIAYRQSDTRRPPQRHVGPISTASTAPEIWVSFNGCVPTYTFRREGNIVVDALVCERRVTEASLTVKN